MTRVAVNPKSINLFCLRNTDNCEAGEKFPQGLWQNLLFTKLKS